eukprot:TRINITY_DN5533_c0_g1_i1.p1 TRINITY_DN5533_c0_g1~~TRINITY_DN5533_c0_g1_i1.p1  ORF type:complete len:582 (+),score=153.78 TRINITY_DN5533_c0_g1_i1:60-1805(+)
MLEEFIIFTSGGVVLWSMVLNDTRGVPVNSLISNVLLEQKSAMSTYTLGQFGVQWRQSNELHVVFAAIYNKTLNVPYLDSLLDSVYEVFTQKYANKLKAGGFSYEYNFDETFQQLWKQIQEETRAAKSTLKRPTRFEDTKKGKKLIKEGRLKKPDTEASAEAETEETSEDEPTEAVDDLEAERQAFIAMRAKKGGKKPGGYVPKNKKKPTTHKKGGKRGQTWGKTTKDEAAALNFSDPVGDGFVVEDDGDELGAHEAIDLNAFEDDSDEEDLPSKAGGFFSYISSFTNKVLTEEDLAPALAKFEKHLFSLNVARDIAENLCASVSKTLAGKTHSSFSSLTTTVKAAMEEALTKILTPKRSIDVLRDARAKSNKPFVITFVGVNGVGKSTSLAKVCSWLLQNKMKVLIAACDTFRSGAVEQLQVHARRLGVEVYHRGYGKDAAAVAGEAIKVASKTGIDVVLIDTAGRMQENEPLMKALGKLVATNPIDLTLFVGEALVGNDSVDQLNKFNLAIEEFGGKGVRGIDGIILTKFDTVDEKVGAAISMVYSTGLPIVFTGVGQKYSDLRVLDVKRVVHILQRGQ